MKAHIKVGLIVKIIVKQKEIGDFFFELNILPHKIFFVLRNFLYNF